MRILDAQEQEVGIIAGTFDELDPLIDRPCCPLLARILQGRVGQVVPGILDPGPALLAVDVCDALAGEVTEQAVGMLFTLVAVGTPEGLEAVLWLMVVSQMPGTGYAARVARRLNMSPSVTQSGRMGMKGVSLRPGP